MTEASSQSLRNFFIIFTGQTISLIGSRLVQFSLVWWLTQQTGSANVLAFASIMAILPQAILGPFAGVLVDRWNRKRVMLLADTGIALVTVVLAFLYTSGTVQIWHIYALMFIRSLGGAFHWTSMQASTSLMVPREQIARVAGLNQSVSGIASIVAPPMGALLIEILPIQYVLGIDIVTAVFAIVPLLVIHVPQPPQQLSRAKTVLEDLRGGLNYVIEWKGLMIIMVMSLTINLLISPAFSLLPLLITSYFKGGALELAWIQSANGLGMILGGLLLGMWGGFKSRVKTAFVALVIAGVCILGFSQTPPDVFPLAVVSIFIFGVTNSIANSSFFAALQTLVPPEVQGRVFTLAMAASTIAQPIGLAVAGPVSEILSIRGWFVIGGVAFIVMALLSFSTPAVMKLEDTAPPEYRN
jgi:DHA3 family macrolide efflux protein-like MFS transporter